jgi:hypothetical protein
MISVHVNFIHGYLLGLRATTVSAFYPTPIAMRETGWYNESRRRHWKEPTYTCIKRLYQTSALMTGKGTTISMLCQRCSVTRLEGLTVKNVLFNVFTRGSVLIRG